MTVGTMLGRQNLDSAFHCLPMNSLQCLGIMVQGKICIDGSLPLGSSTSCCIFKYEVSMTIYMDMTANQRKIPKWLHLKTLSQNT